MEINQENHTGTDIQAVIASFEWRCRGCRVLLGVGHQGRVYISFAGAQYAMPLPVEAVCRKCHAYNATTFMSVTASPLFTTMVDWPSSPVSRVVPMPSPRRPKSRPSLSMLAV